MTPVERRIAPPRRPRTGGRQFRRGAQRPVPVGVELGQLAVDVDRVGVAEVDVLVVGRPDVGEDFVVDPPAASA
jgi:hypothetical protein